ncbi:MAG TPA: cytochrome-c oxidase, cbb3-type subunit III [Thermohalobaculum sp.]|nr:cytochrome-c oxidase, cbb3-type subunit III [Thermohalobaculum sp.]
MSVGERDPHTGHMTTGHEWNGIKELNTPVPRLVWVALGLTVAFSVIWWILFPAWPLGVTYTKGLLGIDQRSRVAEELRAAAADRAEWTGRIAATDPAGILAEPDLMEIVRRTGPALFGDNCAVCHGADAKGGPGFPDLTDGAWLWGGAPATVLETLRVGINDIHDETRSSQMLAFGRDGLLDRSEVAQVVAYVQSLSDPAAAEGAPGAAESVEAGATVYAENCAACHADGGTGMTELGAPDLTDGHWVYGGDRAAIFASVWRGRQGHMPAWEGRLSEVELKLLAAYVLDLGGAGR